MKGFNQDKIKEGFSSVESICSSASKPSLFGTTSANIFYHCRRFIRRFQKLAEGDRKFWCQKAKTSGGMKAYPKALIFLLFYCSLKHLNADSGDTFEQERIWIIIIIMGKIRVREITKEKFKIFDLSLEKLHSWVKFKTAKKSRA